MNQVTEITAQGEEYLEAVCRIRDRGALVTPTAGYFSVASEFLH